MATILIKKKDTSGAPAAGDLTNSTGGAEIAVNTADKRVYAKNSGGTVVELGTNPSSLQVNSAFTFPTADGTNGQVLSTNGSGVVSWSSAAAGDVTLNGTQTLTNKTISADSNTLSGIAASSFVLSNASGNIDGSAAQKAIPTGDVVGTSDSQTLTNKTLSVDDNTVSGIAASSFVVSNASGNIDGTAAQKAIPSGAVVGTTDSQTLTNKTLTDPAIIGTILEDVYTITDGAAFEIDPGNGSVQLITLGASRTPKATNFAAGEAITLMVDDGTAYAITWTDATFGGSGVVWKTNAGVAPTLNTSGYTAIVLWKVGTQVYGARVGDA